MAFTAPVPDPFDSPQKQLYKILTWLLGTANGDIAASPTVSTTGVPAASAVTVQGYGVSGTKSFTRPQNATLYTAGDVIGIADAVTPANAGSAIHEITNFAPAGSRVTITKAALVVNLTSVPSGMANYRIHIFNAAPTAILDNAAFDVLSADRSKYLGYLDLVTPEDLGSTLYSSNRMADDIKLADGQTSIWVLLETRGGYTPTSAEGYEIRLRGQLV